jgi:hypothetical protein
MSSAAIAEINGATFGAWETQEQVRFGRLDNLTAPGQPLLIAPTMRSDSRKHPVLAANSHGQIILVWTEGTGWQKGGALAWQVFDRLGSPMPDSAGRVEGVPAWSFAGVFANSDDGFTILY